MRTFIFSLTVGLSIHSFAEEKKLDAASEKALSETQELLNDKTQRKEAIKKGGAKAKAADDFVNQLTGGSDSVTDDVYALAAEVFANVVKESGGDGKKMA